MFFLSGQRRHSVASVFSNASSQHDDDDISSCAPALAAPTYTHAGAASPSSTRPRLTSSSMHANERHDSDFPARADSRQSSVASERSCGGMSAEETRELWRCMLELQELYGCYNSTRIDLAVSAGDDAVDLMPTSFIIDTLNQSVHDLPDEGWEMLDQHLGLAGRVSPAGQN
jgi:hypothetical protein